MRFFFHFTNLTAIQYLVIVAHVAHSGRNSVHSIFALFDIECCMQEQHSTPRVKQALGFAIFVRLMLGSTAYSILTRTDVLNRFSDHANRAHTVHVMKYIFPRQFGLHNVFTSKTDYKETAQPFKDYTMREEEISQLSSARSKVGSSSLHAPKRLRGQAFELVRKLQKLHHRCSYTELLRHYCPVKSRFLCMVVQKANAGQEKGLRPSQDAGSSSLDLACPQHQVSAFVRAVIVRVWPKEFFGSGDVGDHNWLILFKSIDLFIRSRRFESMSLDSILAGIKVEYSMEKH